jgi:uncharacterized protein (TIGR02922 family)
MNMQIDEQLVTVTIIYYDDLSLQLQHEVLTLRKNNNGRVIISDEAKKNKSIVAVCEGRVNILNKIGERILPVEQLAS